MTDTTATPAASGTAPELERERLILEARRLVTDAAGVDLSADAAARFSEIEQRLDALRADEPAPVRQTVSATAGIRGMGTQPDPYAEFGVLPGLPSLLPTRESIVQLHQAVRERRPHVVHTELLDFATLTTTQSGRDVDYIVGRAVSPRRLAEFAQLPSETVSWGSSTAYPIFGSGTDAANVVAEAAAKPEYDDVTAGSVTPSTIAIWTDMTNQALSISGFESRLRAKLGALVARREDQLLIATVDGTTDIQSHAPSAEEDYADSLLTAAAKVSASELGAEADVCVLNPQEVPLVFGGGTGITGESPDSRFRLTVHGMRVYVSSHQTAGEALVGSWAAAAGLVWGLRPQFLTNPYSGLKNNVTTLLCEEAVGLAVFEPTAFCQVTFNDGSA